MLSASVEALRQKLGESHLSKVEAFQRAHKSEVLTVVFTDLVGSTRLKSELGDTPALEVVQAHHRKVRELLRGFADGEEIETAGDSFLLVFTRPSDAVRFALQLQKANREMSGKARVLDRIGLHTGEIHVLGGGAGSDRKSLFGLQVDTCARIQGLAEGGQTLKSRFAFDNARQVLKGQDLAGLGPLDWRNYGS